jgi:hypothetical protein
MACYPPCDGLLDKKSSDQAINPHFPRRSDHHPKSAVSLGKLHQAITQSEQTLNTTFDGVLL